MKTPCGHNWQSYTGTGKTNIYKCSICETEAVHFKHSPRNERLVDIEQVSQLLELYSQALTSSEDCLMVEYEGCAVMWDAYNYSKSNLNKFLGDEA